MNAKTVFKNAWNEPKLFFFYLALLCASGLALAFILETNTSSYHPSQTAQWFAIWIVVLLALGCVTGILGFILSWIPPVHRFLNWMLRRRFFLFAALITLFALFYTVENWRGKHAWQKFERELKSKGEKVDVAGLAPPSVPDDQNFAMAPIWVEEISATMGPEKAKRWYGEKVAAVGHTNFVRRLEMPIELSEPNLNFTNNSGNWQKAEKADLKSWQQYYRELAGVTNFFPTTPQPQTPAADVLLALSRYDAAIDELRVASQLPYARFPLGYDDDNPAAILLPHLARIRHCFDALRLRACAEIEAGKTDEAVEDVRLMLRLIEVLQQEPLLISHLVANAMQTIATQPIWEGLAGHHWNDSQLAALESELSKLDFLAGYHFSMRGERAFGVAIIDYLRRNRNEVEAIQWGFDGASQQDLSFEQMMSGAFIRIMPGGWFDHNKVSICQMHEKYMFPVVDLQQRVVSLETQKRASEATDEDATRPSPYNWFTRRLLPPLNKIAPKSARAQFFVDAARIASALERYRLANGSFPETLAVLSPAFLKTIPHDIMNGKPLNYRRTDDGQFILYSVGWNETDDGGRIELTTGGRGNVDADKGDWVWKYPSQ